MARVYTEGAEMQDILFFDGVNATTPPTVSTTVYASGGASYRFGYSGSYASKNNSALAEAISGRGCTTRKAITPVCAMLPLEI